MREQRVGGTVTAAVRDGRTGDVTPTTLSGYAAVFGVETVVGGAFREVIARGAFDQALARPDDVRALINHDVSLVLGRTTARTLRLSVDARGLRYDVDLPDTTYARDLATSVARGDVTQSSFGFRVVADTWEQSPAADGLPLRCVRSVELYDVSPVTYPAYGTTSVSTGTRTTLGSATTAAAELERLRHLGL